MENKDQPAFALNKVRFVSEDGATYFDDTKLGLTKRELIAAMAMQGMLSNLWDGYKNIDEGQSIAKAAVNYADSLLKQLSGD